MNSLPHDMHLNTASFLSLSCPVGEVLWNFRWTVRLFKVGHDFPQISHAMEGSLMHIRL